MPMHLQNNPTAKDIMERRVSVIESNSTIREATRKMKKNQVRELIVVSGRDAVGILVDRDITNKLVAEDKDPDQTKVKEIMTQDLVTAVEDDSLSDIAKGMIKNNVSRIPVVRGEQLIGLITYQHILKTWPGYIDVLKEEIDLLEEESSDEEVIHEGICESCDNFSDSLKFQDGQWLCPECL